MLEAFFTKGRKAGQGADENSTSYIPEGVRFMCSQAHSCEHSDNVVVKKEKACM
jgi:hypothetical protein